MKKNKFLAIFLLILMGSSCSIFHRNQGLPCPSGGANIGAERLLGGDKKAIKASQGSKFKGSNKIY